MLSCETFIGTMNEPIKYKFLFRIPGEDPLIVVHATRPGNAEGCAKKMAKLVAKKYRAESAECVWMGPEEKKIPEEIMKEIRKERVS